MNQQYGHDVDIGKPFTTAIVSQGIILYFSAVRNNRSQPGAALSVRAPNFLYFNNASPVASPDALARYSFYLGQRNHQTVFAIMAVSELSKCESQMVVGAAISRT